MSWSISRIGAVARKTMERGFSWFLRRLKVEVTSPYTTHGKLGRKIMARDKPATALAEKSNQDTLTCFFDFELCPVTYDICSNLLMAEAERLRLGLDGFRMIFVPGYKDGLRYEEKDYEEHLTIEHRRSRIWNILLPAIRTMPTCQGFYVCRTREEADEILSSSGPVYPPSYSPDVPAAFPLRMPHPDEIAPGHEYPSLKPDLISMETMRNYLQTVAAGKKVITVTIRNYGYNPRRNSQINVWAEFLNGLDPEVYVPIILPDTETCYGDDYKALEKYPFCREAAINVGWRMALYDLAWLNMGIGNGPLELCYFNPGCRYLSYIELLSAPQTQPEALQNKGFTVDGDFPFSKPWQHIVWQKDNFDVLSTSFAEMRDRIDRWEADSSIPTKRG